MSRPLRVAAFGGLSVLADGDTRPLGAAVRQRRPLALLALLAASGEAGVSRDKLTAILWPDAEPERARQTLAQTLYSLRRATGVEQLVLGVGDLRLNPDLVSSDLADFDAALRGGRLEDAVAAYRGPFLDGFRVPGTDDFDRWVEGERQRLGGRYAGALRALAGRAEGRGDGVAAVQWWRQLVAADPLDATSTVALVDALGRAGDLTGAERAARVHEALVRDQLDLPLAPAISERLRALRADAAARALQVGRGSDRSGSDVPLVEAPAERAVTLHDRPDVDGPGGTHARGKSEAPADAAPSAERSRTRKLALAAGGLLLLTSGMALGVAVDRVGVRQPQEVASSPLTGGAGLVAVLPLANETGDRSLDALGEGTADLLARMLTGSVGPRAVDRDAVRGALAREGGSAQAIGRADARDVGAAVGADEILVGHLTGNASRLTLSASLVRVRSGSEGASAEVTGPADSLPALADALAAALLAGREVGWEGGGAFARTSLRTLQTYLQAEEAYRADRLHRALGLYARALDRDSTFAPAALAMAIAADRLNGASPDERGLALAWGARDRLGERDRIRLLALAGPRFPEPSPASEQLAAWERAVSVSPDRAASWSELGERLFYDGAALGIRNASSRSAAAFRRALELDPHDGAAARHLVELAVRARDREGLASRRTSELLPDAGKHLAGYLAWRVALARGDTAALARIRDSIPSFGPASLRAMALAAQHDVVGLTDGERALRYVGARAALASEQFDVLLAQHSLALNAGRPVRALDVTEQLQDVRPRARAHLRLRVLDALYADGDTAAARVAVRELAPAADRAPGAGERERSVWLADACVLAQWRAARLATAPRASRASEVAAIRRAIAGLRSAALPRVSVPLAAAPHACATLVDAMLGVALRTADAAGEVERFATLAFTGPALGDASAYTMLAVARLFEQVGDPQRALAAVRKRPYLKGWPRYLAVALREEGRLALAVGDEAGARAAYDRYLAFRTDPEAALRPEVDAVRAIVRRLAAAQSQAPPGVATR